MSSYGACSSTPPPKSPGLSRLSAAQSRGFLVLNTDSGSPMHVHGQGALTNLIKNQASYSSDVQSGRRASLDEEQVNGETHGRRSGDMDERRLSAVLNTPQMRSMRLIGKSNPRYQWEKYWKTDEELSTMKKPM